MTENDDFIAKNLHRRVEDIALEIAGRKDLDAAYVLRQIEGRQRLAHKVPKWAATPGITFPPRLALEQCSGEAAALYKAATIRRLLPEGQRGSMADITAGMGVDFSFIAPLFGHAIYVERNAEIARTARRNMPLLGIENAEFIEGNGLEVLKSLPGRTDLIFVDPARRDAHGGKTVLIEDCEPDIAANLNMLLKHCRIGMVKLSPMLDIHRAAATLNAIQPGCVREIHVMATGGECKELMLVLEAGGDTAEPTIYCSEEGRAFSFKASEEAVATCEIADETGQFLYEPGPGALKAGAFKTIARRYGLKKLHPNTHLYTSATPVGDFPGRTFRTVGCFGFSKGDLKQLGNLLKTYGETAQKVAQAHLAVRNFPASVAELRKRLKIREGGQLYLFAATLGDGKKSIIACEKTTTPPAAETERRA